MPAVDRTAEFREVVELRRRRQQGPRTPRPAGPKKRSDFAAAASGIGADIHATAAKLERLTQLAQSNSLLLFADPTEEINQLTLIVKQDIASLNAKLSELQRAMRDGRGSASRQQASHSSSIVEQLKARLLDSAKDFQGLLQTRKESVQMMQDRRQKLAAPTPPQCRCADGAGASAESHAPRSIFECGSPLGMATPPSSMGAANGAHAGGGAFAFDAFEWGSRWGSSSSKYLSSRTHAVESVQSTIVELGSIFEQLSTLVAEQGEMARRVDENVDDALASTQAGYEQLQRYWRNLSSSRGLAVRVLAVLMFFIVIFGTFF
ncbi:syntaxin 5 [Emiliania huxleyi CCMP1516]|uniref:t-SNARE coiled-coil homology domain-containing protein n=2 Tax=Emiliania huxleyi TaxID=2903 RepID=A0A0D3HY21_EMIH1|nr:syntaxin 5 [Emiliania huxleyi CCMP1516]EOD03906.1 syntaxin 5 [Emiliania huxleyi CCMP1516]|eukprot:XP_005756335.1 syntaxin 5 [Emiliania huxleyi CCMP1516]